MEETGKSLKGAGRLRGQPHGSASLGIMTQGPRCRCHLVMTEVIAAFMESYMSMSMTPEAKRKRRKKRATIMQRSGLGTASLNWTGTTTASQEPPLPIRGRMEAGGTAQRTGRTRAGGQRAGGATAERNTTSEKEAVGDEILVKTGRGDSRVMAGTGMAEIGVVTGIGELAVDTVALAIELAVAGELAGPEVLLGHCLVGAAHLQPPLINHLAAAAAVQQRLAHGSEIMRMKMTTWRSVGSRPQEGKVAETF